MKTGTLRKPKRRLTVLLCVLLTVFCGCANNAKIPTTPLEKLESEANVLISQGDYPGGIEVYAKALEDESLHRDVLVKIEKTYRDWMLEKAKDINATMDDLLRIPEELNRRFPEAVEYAEQLVSNICTSYLSRGLEKGVEQMEAIQAVMLERYKHNEYISRMIIMAVDNLIYTHLSTIVRELVVEGLPEKLENEEFAAVFRLIDDEKLMEICHRGLKYNVFPVYGWVNENETMLIDYTDDILQLRIGYHDEEWLLGRDAASICYYQDPQDPSVYKRQIVYGYFEKGLINGKFVELMEIGGTQHVFGRTEGMMKESRFDGKITGEYTVENEEITGSITFNDGVPVSLGKVTKDGRTYHVVSREGDHEILYSEEEMNIPHGMMPYYEISY